MTPERFARIRSCFEAVAGLPADERAGRLRKLTGDAEVIDEVLALCDAGAGDTRMSVSIGAALASAVIRPPAPGDVLGIWRIEREIGQGGMGSVFLAERNDGHFRQRAAVKLLRGLPNAESLALFTRERQLLATLTHPSIGRLLDGGATPHGQPYLVMEYVEGAHIDGALPPRATRCESDPGALPHRLQRRRVGAPPTRHPLRPEAFQPARRRSWTAGVARLRHRPVGRPR